MQIFCLFLFIFSVCLTATAQIAPDKQKAAYETGAGIFKKYVLPGLTIAVAKNGKIIWSENYGAADIEKARRARIDTKYLVGSISKLLTAAALMRLSEKKLIDLDAPVQKYVLDFPPKNFPVTLRRLAGHTAGIRHYEYKDFAIFGGKNFRDTAEGLQIFQNDPLRFEPGTDYFYSSYGYNLLGAAIESAAKKPFARVIEEEVTKPLKMKNTVGDLETDAETADKAVFYKRGADKQLIKTVAVQNQHRLPSGGYLSTAEDLLNFGNAFLKAGYLKKQTLAEMLDSQKLKNGTETNVSIGWRIKLKPNGSRIFHHGGAIEGGRAFLLIDEKSKTVVVLLANLMSDFGEAEAERIAAIFSE
jgi:CubicO group peptidase (beta-lactamase class C family)